MPVNDNRSQRSGSQQTSTDNTSIAINTAKDKWSISSRIFHWGSVVLLFITWLMIFFRDYGEGYTFINLHKAFGVSLLLWMLARLCNRFVSKDPKPAIMPNWQKGMAHFTHFSLYLLLIAMPIAGLLMSMYGGHGVSIFGLFEIPTLVETNRSTARFFNDIHVDIIWPLIVLFTGIHIAGALYHQFVQKDNLINRMK
ncbi:cytochrome b [Psychrobacter sp. I-STPA10]|uniref:cytochrome b n=1 Tax=Psychrobacter sp. I-STPA10 TaxID=2585769 RepID=UPI001E59B8C2|nr:cytochrome b [Psychrobacter sp. I-STPA10]